MTLSTFAFIAGLTALIVYIPMLVNGRATAKVFMKMTEREIFMRSAGALGIVLTAIVLKDGYAVGTDPEGLIRLVAWIGLIKGVIAAWWPDIIVRKCTKLCKNKGFLPIWGIAGVALGGFLLYGSTVV